MKRQYFGAGLAALAVLLCGAPLALAQTAPPLGVVQQFSVLGNSAVTGSTGGGTVVMGDVGSSPTASISNFPPSTVTAGFSVHATNDGTVVTARANANSAYGALAAQGPGTTIPAQLSGAVLTSGVYSFTGGAADIAAGGVLTLNGPGIFIFQVTSALTANVGSSIAGSASPCNVYWRVGTDATLNGTSFSGQVFAQASITVGAAANVTGRVIAGTGATGAVTMAGAGGNTIGGCASVPVVPPVCPVITLTPLAVPNGTVNVAYSQALTGNGGTAPYTFSLTAGTLPVGLSLTPGGVIAGTPTTAGTSNFTIRATDANGCAGILAYSITIAAAPPPPPGCPVITMAPATLPNTTAGVAYNQTLSATGGATPYSFGVTAGALPPGLVLTSAGVLSGTATTAGTFGFTIQATDANGCFIALAYSIVVAAAPPPPPGCPVITLAPLTLPGTTAGVAYEETISATGGTAPYSFGVTAGALPGGLVLSATGVLSGTPTTAGTFNFTIRGTDANGCFAVLAYMIVVAAAPPPPPGCPVITMAPSSLPGTTAGVAYNQTITASGGTAPYSFGVTAGALPGGLVLSSTGVLSGTATTAGTFNFTVRGTDANGCFAVLAYMIVVAAAPPPPPGCPVITVNPPSLPGGVVGVLYSQSITATGGTAPYRFGLTAGALPRGLILTSAGLLSGTPATAGTFTFTIRGTDANGCFAERVYSINITTPVPTMPQTFFMGLALLLLAVGYTRLVQNRSAV